MFLQVFVSNKVKMEGNVNIYFARPATMYSPKIFSSSPKMLVVLEILGNFRGRYAPIFFF